MSELTPPVALPLPDALLLLECGELTVEGRVTTASNATLYCRIELDGVAAACVYKPISGERPLWDYPDGTLAEREVACYEISAATGWNIIPPTVLRAGPLGTGMVQLWVEDDESIDIIRHINDGSSTALQRVALLDAVLNNSDRKVSHLLPVSEQQVYGVDHGVSLGVENKLRTVLWQWAGEPIPAEGQEMLRALDTDWETDRQARPSLADTLAELLTTAEVRAARRRVQRLLTKRTFPLPPSDWPAIPYPPY
ncbi:MAG TPA: SCO1664 family protein [Jatrophihabitans sp.]|nr:SCO1664 family protein [Jatrophihabitans sp.]